MDPNEIDNLIIVDFDLITIHSWFDSQSNLHLPKFCVNLVYL